MTSPQQAHTSGQHRRLAIREAIVASNSGWIRTTDLADLMGLDRSTVLHHAKIMVTQGTAALGQLRRLGEAGRPPRVVIDPDRLADIPSQFKDTDKNGHTCNYELILDETPDEYGPPKLGPIGAALAGTNGDELAAAIADRIGAALFQEIANGRLVVTITTPNPLSDQLPATTPTTPTDDEDPS